MARQHTKKTSFAVALLVGSFYAVAASGWNDHVVSACNPDKSGEASTESMVCAAYIEGFLDGAIVTDAAVVESLTSTPTATSDYLKRAYSTRVGWERGKLPATALAHFCLPEETARADVVSAIVTALEASGSRDSGDVATSVYNILSANYPCQD